MERPKRLSCRLACPWTVQLRRPASAPARRLRTDRRTAALQSHGFAGGSPVVVFHSFPGGTSHSPRHAQAQSVFSTVSRCAATNAGTGHIPCGSPTGQPRTLESGATPSLMTMRIWGSDSDEHESTDPEGQRQNSTIQDSDDNFPYLGLACSSRTGIIGKRQTSDPRGCDPLAEGHSPQSLLGSMP